MVPHVTVPTCSVGKRDLPELPGVRMSYTRTIGPREEFVVPEEGSRADAHSLPAMSFTKSCLSETRTTRA
jgi:hypothetical protein